MWEERALRLRGSLTDLAATGLSVGELYRQAVRLVDPVVGSDLTCWATLDPETLVITSMTSGSSRIPVQYEPVLAAIEYADDEPHRFAALARRQQGLLRASDLPRTERERSPRFMQVWRPLGIDRELRVLFSEGGVCWGAAGLVRSGVDFTDRESEFLQAIAPSIATATRLALRAYPRGPRPDPGPAIVVMTREGRPRSLTPGARQWRRRIDDLSPGLFTTMMHIMAAGSQASASGECRSRIRDGDGWWLMLRASPLIGEEQLTAVVLEPARGREILDLLLRAHGLTARERAICDEVLAGHSTTDIAEHLFISTNTVQDHLKSIFAKCGVHSRGRLTALLQLQLPPESASGPAHVTTSA